MYFCKKHGEVDGLEAVYRCQECGWVLTTCALCDGEMTVDEFNAAYLSDHPWPEATYCNACGSLIPLNKEQ